MALGSPAVSRRVAPPDVAATTARAAAAAIPDFRFATIRDLEGLDAIEAIWNRLANSGATSQQGFQAFAVIRSWVFHYAPESGEPHIVVGYFDGRPALIWPLVRRKTFGLERLAFLGEPLCQYHDILIDRDAPAAALLAAAFAHLAASGYDILELRRVRSDSRLASFLIERGEKITSREAAPFVDFSGFDDFASFEKTLSPKGRSCRRRRMKQIAALGAIAFEREVSPQRADELIDLAMHFKQQWARQDARYAPAVFDPRFAACFRDAARSPDPDARLRILAILRDGRPIGVEISYGYRDRLLAHVLAPDPAYAQYGLGNTLADAAIRDAFERGYKIYDLLAPANPFKSAWATGAIEVLDFTLTASRRGAFFDRLIASSARPLARAAFKSAPRGIRRMMLVRAFRRAG
jgi:CelD/BcsL family acetyltransferase involved in cellulose biosynthesis